MAEEEIYKIVIAQPAKNRYHESVLPYIYENFSFERAIEVDDNILRSTETLDRKPDRGRKEKRRGLNPADFSWALLAAPSYIVTRR